jgi:hypothetical protein
MSIANFTDKLLEEFDKNMTDQVFLFIESNRDLMKAYLHTVAEYDDLKVVNSQIAQAICKHYNRISTNKSNNAPKSKLIQSFEEFK